MEATTSIKVDTTYNGEPNPWKAAERYITRGWQPVPIPKGEKGPNKRGWEDGGFGPLNFSPTQNVGLILDKSGLTEVDFDCEEAGFVGARTLPDTLEDGRGGRLRKAFYVTSLDKVYRDIGGFEDGKLTRRQGHGGPL